MASAAVGFALAVVAATLSSWIREPGGGGWFMYSPNSSQVYSVSSEGRDWATPALWLAAIGVWLAVSWRLFRSRD